MGSVLERALFAFVDVERAAGPAPPAAPPGPLVCQAAAAVLSALTPQVGHGHYVKETEMVELDLRWCGDLGYHTKGCGYHAIPKVVDTKPRVVDTMPKELGEN